MQACPASQATESFESPSQMKQNARMKSSEDEVFLMSDEIVTELRDGIVEHIGALHCLRSMECSPC